MADVGVQKAQCVHCRVPVAVPDSYAHGDHVKCGACRTKHKVVRGDRLRLVIADVGPLREALAQNQQLTSRLEAELAQARASLGVGANGLGIAVAYAVYQVGWNGVPIDRDLLWACVAIAIVSGLLLEGANWAFLAKRHAITRLSKELADARTDGARLRTQVREASRV